MPLARQFLDDINPIRVEDHVEQPRKVLRFQFFEDVHFGLFLEYKKKRINAGQSYYHKPLHVDRLPEVLQENRLEHQLAQAADVRGQVNHGVAAAADFSEALVILADSLDFFEVQTEVLVDLLHGAEVLEHVSREVFVARFVVLFFADFAKIAE